MHFYSLSTLALTAVLAASSVAALGINCRGSSECRYFYNRDNGGSVANNLRKEIAAHVSDSRWYQNGQHIVCIDGEVNLGSRIIYRSVCAFLQGTGGYPGNEIKKLAQRIVDHGCATCGSVPVFYDQGDNNVDSHGQLTFNYVDRLTDRDGTCSAIRGKCQYE